MLNNSSYYANYQSILAVSGCYAVCCFRFKHHTTTTCRRIAWRPVSSSSGKVLHKIALSLHYATGNLVTMFVTTGFDQQRLAQLREMPTCAVYRTPTKGLSTRIYLLSRSTPKLWSPCNGRSDSQSDMLFKSKLQLCTFLGHTPGLVACVFRNTVI